MENSTKTTIGISALSTIIGMLLVLGGINIMEDEAYYCEARGIVMPCDSLSQYYGLSNGKCWNSELGNKLCRSGWLLGVNDEVSQDEPDSVEPEQLRQILSPGNSGDYVCHPPPRNYCEAK